MRKIDEAYEFIKKYIAEKDYPPTIREIGDAINIKSTSTISYYLRKLKETNKIVKGSYKNRSIQLTENINTRLENSDLVTMPYIKTVTMGKPLMSDTNIDGKFVFSGSMFKGFNMFLMTVNNDTMENGSILKGDMVVVSRQNVARNGELVVALVEGKCHIGRLYREFQCVRLQPDNNYSDPIYAKKITILGKVVGVIRNEID